MIPVGGPVGKSRAAENCMYGQQPQDAAAGKGRLQAVQGVLLLRSRWKLLRWASQPRKGDPDRLMRLGRAVQKCLVTRTVSCVLRSQRVGLRSGCGERGAVLVPVNPLQGPLTGNLASEDVWARVAVVRGFPSMIADTSPKTDSSWRCQRTRYMRGLPMRTPIAAWQRSPWRNPCPASTDGCCDKGGKRAL